MRHEQEKDAGEKEEEEEKKKRKKRRKKKEKKEEKKKIKEEEEEEEQEEKEKEEEEKKKKEEEKGKVREGSRGENISLKGTHSETTFCTQASASTVPIPPRVRLQMESLILSVPHDSFSQSNTSEHSIEDQDFNLWVFSENFMSEL